MKESDKLIWMLSIIKANNFTFKVIHLEMENQRSNLLNIYNINIKVGELS